MRAREGSRRISKRNWVVAQRGRVLNLRAERTTQNVAAVRGAVLRFFFNQTSDLGRDLTLVCSLARSDRPRGWCRTAPKESAKKADAGADEKESGGFWSSRARWGYQEEGFRSTFAVGDSG